MRPVKIQAQVLSVDIVPWHVLHSFMMKGIFYCDTTNKEGKVTRPIARDGSLQKGFSHVSHGYMGSVQD
jgi:hypothetical protein